MTTGTSFNLDSISSSKDMALEYQKIRKSIPVMTKNTPILNQSTGTPTASMLGRAVSSVANPILGRVLPTRSTLIKMQFGAKKQAPKVEDRIKILEEKGYWTGEWICATCGYIYEPGKGPAFEELPLDRYKCPQCFVGKRRFVKNSGPFVGLAKLVASF